MFCFANAVAFGAAPGVCSKYVCMPRQRLTQAVVGGYVYSKLPATANQTGMCFFFFFVIFFTVILSLFLYIYVYISLSLSLSCVVFCLLQQRNLSRRLRHYRGGPQVLRNTLDELVSHGEGIGEERERGNTRNVYTTSKSKSWRVTVHFCDQLNTSVLVLYM